VAGAFSSSSSYIPLSGPTTDPLVLVDQLAVRCNEREGARRWGWLIGRRSGFGDAPSVCCAVVGLLCSAAGANSIGCKHALGFQIATRSRTIVIETADCGSPIRRSSCAVL